MNNDKETISKEEAAATLKSVDLTKRDLAILDAFAEVSAEFVPEP